MPFLSNARAEALVQFRRRLKAEGPNPLDYVCDLWHIISMGTARGKFINYDNETIAAELGGIPSPDLGLLFSAMGRYSEGDDVGFTIKDYDEGLLMLKKDRRNGRLLFSHDATTGPRPVSLLAYKKESQKAPQNLIATARERRGRWIEARKRGGR